MDVVKIVWYCIWYRFISDNKRSIIKTKVFWTVDVTVDCAMVVELISHFDFVKPFISESIDVFKNVSSNKFPVHVPASHIVQFWTFHFFSFINCFMRKELCSNALRPKKRHYLHALRDLIHVWNILWSTPSPQKTKITFKPRILLPQRQRRQRCRSVGSTPVPPSTSTSSSLPTSRTPSSPSPPTKTPSRRPQTISSIQKCEKQNHNKKKTFKRKADVTQNAFSHNYKIKKCFTSSSVWLSFSNMLDIFPNSRQS